MSKTKLFNLLTLGAIALGLVGCEQEPQEPQEQQQEVIEIEQVQEQQKPQEIKQKVELNKPLIIKEFGEESLQIKITGVRFTEERNEFEEKEFENVVVFKVELENIGENEVFVDGGELFNVYDMNGNILETYANSDYEFDRAYEINPTRKATLEIAYGIPTGNEFEMEVVADLWESGVIGSLFFKGTEPQEQELNKQEVQEQEVQEQDLGIVETYDGTLQQFIGEIVLSAEQENAPLVQQMLVLCANSLDGQTYSLVDNTGQVIYAYTNGEMSIDNVSKLLEE